MPSSAHDSDAAQARLVLGLSGAATEAELQAAYWALRAHIEARAGASEDLGFIAARTSELQLLTERLAAALDVPADSLPPLQLDSGRPAPARRFPVGLGVAAFAGVLTVGLLFWMFQAQDDSTDASPLAAVAPDVPPGRLVFPEDAAPARFTVLDAEGSEVVRAGLLPSAPIEVAPGEYAVWVSALGCDASRQHVVRVETETDLALGAPECTRSIEVVVRSDVTGDIVRIDGEVVGGTGPAPHALGAGEHEISIEHEGEQAWLARVAVGDEDRVTLFAQLDSSGGGGAEAGAANVQRRDSPETPASRADTAPTGVTPSARPETGGAGGVEQPGGGLPDMGRNTDLEAVRDGRAGSRNWHDAVRRRLVDKYDENASRDLDTTIEIASIPCTEWRAIESQYEAGGLQVPMTRLYGFDGSEWVEGALGIERSLRDFTYHRMRECGLK